MYTNNPDQSPIASIIGTTPVLESSKKQIWISLQNPVFMSDSFKDMRHANSLTHL